MTDTPEEVRALAEAAATECMPVETHAWYNVKDAVEAAIMQDRATRAALAAEPEPQPVAEGWQAVVVEPTDAMLRAGSSFAMKVSLGGDYRWHDYMRDLWHVMSSASPHLAEEPKT